MIILVKRPHTHTQTECQPSNIRNNSIIMFSSCSRLINDFLVESIVDKFTYSLVRQLVFTLRFGLWSGILSLSISLSLSLSVGYDLRYIVLCKKDTLSKATETQSICGILFVLRDIITVITRSLNETKYVAAKLNAIVDRNDEA